MISQPEAKAAILPLWASFKTSCATDLEFKHMKVEFTDMLLSKHPELLKFKCNGSDKIFSQQRNVVESWLSK
jgi:hypothetical protein